MLTFPTSLRVYAHRFATDMRNYAGTVFMPSRTLPAQHRCISRATRATGQ